MYNNPYYNQPTIDRINAQMNELEKLREQLQKPITPPPTNLTQNFQIAPTNRDVIKYAESIDDVKRDLVVGDTPYFSKDLSIVWIKNTKGDIKIYELNEIIPKDDKDLRIEYLEAQLKELKEGLMKDEFNDDVDEPITKPIESKKSTNVSKVSKSNKYK